MSEKAAKLKTALKQMLQTGSEVMMAEVKKVDKVLCTTDVVADEMELTEVRLRATVEDKAGFKVFPKPGSMVLIQRLGDDQEWFVTMYSEIDEMRIEVTDGVLIKKGDDTARLIIEDTLEQIKAISHELQQVVVAIGVTPNVVALQAIDAQVEAIKNRNAELFK